MLDVLTKIVRKLPVDSTTIVQKKFGKIPEMTAYEVTRRLLNGGNDVPVLVVFPEASHATIKKILRNTFGNVDLSGSKTWYLHALSLINTTYCSGCSSIVPLEGFNKNSAKCSACVTKLNAAYYQNNKASFLARKLKREAQIRQATPAWADLEEMNTFYKNCPDGYEVDHWAPIQGNNVCGLHTLDNLQYLPIAENRSKSNKF